MSSTSAHHTKVLDHYTKVLEEKKGRAPDPKCPRSINSSISWGISQDSSEVLDENVPTGKNLLEFHQ